MLGGGDLDGDEYVLLLVSPSNFSSAEASSLMRVCSHQDPQLHHKRNYEPAAYAPAVKLKLDHKATMDDVSDHFVNYIA